MISDFIASHNLASYRIDQFNHAFYKEYISSYEELTTWPKALRLKIAQAVPFSTLRVITQKHSQDSQTRKLLFERIRDKKRFESVLMQHEDGRNTVCVSCMIGCPLGCFFCATGQMGSHGSLTDREIVDQVMYFARMLHVNNQHITNVVFMGMGEPLLNLENVLHATDVLCDSHKFGLGKRKVIISTSGITPAIYTLIDKEFKGRLTLSLHAPNQKLRESLMPIAKKHPLDELLSACKQFAQKTGKRISYEYLLIDGVNDTPACAHELAHRIGSYLSYVNLIPYNPVPHASYRRSSRATIRRFSDILTKYNIEHSVRVTFGDDIAAACGQLATDTV